MPASVVWGFIPKNEKRLHVQKLNIIFYDGGYIRGHDADLAQYEKSLALTVRTTIHASDPTVDKVQRLFRRLEHKMNDEEKDGLLWCLQTLLTHHTSIGCRLAEQVTIGTRLSSTPLLLSRYDEKTDIPNTLVGLLDNTKPWEWRAYNRSAGLVVAISPRDKTSYVYGYDQDIGKIIMAAFQVACKDPNKFWSVAAEASSFTCYAEKIKDYASNLRPLTGKGRKQLEISGLVARGELQASLRNSLYKLEKASLFPFPLLGGGKEFDLIAAVGTVARLCHSSDYRPPEGKVTMQDLSGLLWHFITLEMDCQGGAGGYAISGDTDRNSGV